MQAHQVAYPNPPPRPSANPLERIGRIVAVTGAHAIILLDATDAFQVVGIERGPEIGTLLKVDTAPSVALAMVSALSSPMPTHNASDQELRIVEVEFIGELPKDEHGRTTAAFRRGISCYPSLGDVVFRATREELAQAYACDAETSIRIGHIQQDPTIPAMVKIDELLGKHFAVLGTTGTGKSCSVALILRRILERNPQAHILLLDVHREYSQSFKEWAEMISPENMNLPFWLLNFDEVVEIVIGGQVGREADIEILRELIPIAKSRYQNNQRKDKSALLKQRGEVIDNSNIGVDTPIPYRASDIIGLLDEALGRLELRNELAPYKRLKARIETISRDPRYAFMFGGLTVQDNMAQVLSRIFRIPVNGKPIAILELGGLPSEIINVCVSVLARLAFDFGVWSAGRIPITFVCEEAHRYVPIDKTLGFEPTKRAISRIAKEGRKYGVSLCIVTQRPAELDPTILSQCNTIFSLRLTNERDQEILRAGISDAAASLLEFMPTMGTGEAITFGEGVALPTRIKFDRLPSHALPKSNTASFTLNWAREMPHEGFLHEVVGRWRAQAFSPYTETVTAEAAPQPVPQLQPVPPAYAPAQHQHAAPPGHMASQRPVPDPLQNYHTQAGLAPQPGQPTLRRQPGPLAPPPPVPMPGQFPAPPAAAPADMAQRQQQQPSLASLIKQMRS
jgi:DNA helicase HerA-like ATPase